MVVGDGRCPGGMVEWEIVRVTALPASGNRVAATAGISEAEGPVPVKSLSSHVMTISELPVHADELVIMPTVLERKASPVAISDWTWEKSHGSLGPPPPRPCMSWHWSGR